MDLLGCPMCDAPACRAVRRIGCSNAPVDRWQAIARGHIVDGLYMLKHYNGQDLLFTAGLQHIRLQDIDHDTRTYREDCSPGSDTAAPLPAVC